VLVEQCCLGVPNVQVATGLRGEASHHLAWHCIRQAHIKGANTCTKTSKRPAHVSDHAVDDPKQHLTLLPRLLLMVLQLQLLTRAVRKASTS